MSLIWIILVTATSVLFGGGVCTWLLVRARELDASIWGLEHIVCPIIRILVLLIIVSQIYPAIDDTSTSLDFWRTLAQGGLFSDLVNILFFGGLLLGFLPIVSHPVFALPIQSLLTVALVFHWQYQGLIPVAALWPSPAALLKIIGYMLIAYFVTREASLLLSRWLDHKLAISGSIGLVADAIYLILQIPVILLYCSYLKAQLP